MKKRPRNWIMTEDNSPRRIDAKINRGVERASELYADNAALRAMVLSIPYLGGGLDVIFTVDGQRAAKERIHRLLEELRQRMAQLEEDAINTEFLGSDAFIDLVIKAFDSATRTRDEEKIRWYAHILAGSTLQQEQAAHLPEEYLHLASELTPKELRVALSAYESQPDLGEPWAEWERRFAESMTLTNPIYRWF
jgi:hypothetical protein